MSKGIPHTKLRAFITIGAQHCDLPDEIAAVAHA